jgi:hypothetical protein
MNEYCMWDLKIDERTSMEFTLSSRTLQFKSQNESFKNAYNTLTKSDKLIFPKGITDRFH